MAEVRATEPRRHPSTSIRLAAGLGVAGAVVLLVGGYGGHWRWTGFGHDTTLWDWLHIFMLPLALTVAPLWLRRRSRLERRRQLIFVSIAAAFGLLVVLGYTLDLHWTGFPGNKLWDWLELLVLPLAVGLIPVWLEMSRKVDRLHVIAGGSLLVGLAVAIVGGYGYGWKWTGFQGNTLFDWLQLFVAPLVLPLVLVPLVRGWMATGVVEPRQTAPERDPGPARQSTTSGSG